jgi:hypothetical protein
MKDIDRRKLKKRFEALGRESLSFDHVKPKLSRFPDLHIFRRLEEWFPESHLDTLIESSENEQIYLFPSPQQLETLSDAQIRELLSCGVDYDERVNELSMYV